MTLRGHILLLTLLALLATVGGGVLLHQSLSGTAHGTLQEAERDNIHDLSEHIGLSISSHQEVTAAMAGMPQFSKLLEGRTPGALAEANALLDHFKTTLKVEVCYLIDRGGTAVASSNRGDPDSFVGKSYAFRPYFTQGMAGRPFVYVALGVTSMKRGVYFSHPVYGKGTEVQGLLVAKDDVNELVEEMSKFTHGPAFMVDPQGVVFASNHSQWLFHLLWEATGEAHAGIVASKQFGPGPFPWTGYRRVSAGLVRDQANREFKVLSTPLKGLPGWTLQCFLDPELLSGDPVLKTLGRIRVFILFFCLGLSALFTTVYLRADREVALRHKVTEDLRRTKEQLEALIQASPLPILILNSAGNVDLWNPAAERVFGWSRSELLGHPLPLVPQGREQEFHEVRRQMLDGKAFTAFETQRQRKDGSILDVALSTAPLRDAAGRTVGTMAVLEDISGRKLAERERSKVQTLQSIGMLAGGIAHDFNNLLASISAIAGLLRMADLPRDGVIEQLSRIEKICLQAGQLSARLITFAPGGKPVRVLVPVQTLVKDAVLEAVTGSPVQAVFHMPSSPLEAKIDEAQIRQVILNLTQNAVEAMPGGGEVVVRVSSLDFPEGNLQALPAGEYLKLSIADHGPGIPAENLPQVFDPYFSTKTSYSQKGLGLGLAVCHSVIRHHGGRIEVESQPGKGTVFTLLLPCS